MPNFWGGIFLGMAFVAAFTLNWVFLMVSVLALFACAVDSYVSHAKTFGQTLDVESPTP